uniref:Beta'-coat protein n=1 Tax=Nannospalax galili TaxID=1026970 RepID=A0A8C6QD94_NANGA
MPLRLDIKRKLTARSDRVKSVDLHPTEPWMLASLYNGSVCVWNHETQNKTCVQTLEGHAQNVSCASFHPELPIIITGSEDGTVRIWHSSTYRLESTLNYGMERVWCVASLRGSNNVALGYDEGSIIVKLGREEPAMSMDANGKIIWAKHSEVQQANLKAMGDAEIKDGERLPLAVKDMGSCEIYPQTIQHNPNGIFWSDSGELVCIATEESFFILKYLSEKVLAAQETHEGVTEDGIEDAFEVLGEIQEIVKTGLWVGDCFIYTSSVNRLNYYVGGEIVTIAHLDRTMYLLGYIPKDNRLYLGDKELNIVSYSLLVSVLEYQTAVMRRDFSMADKVLPTVPKEQRTRVAHFLEKQGFKQQALTVSTDPEHRFELALQLGELKIAYQLAVEAESEQKWKQLAELAISKCQFGLAQECLHHAQDYGGLLLLATASGNASMVNKLAEGAERDGKNNVAFMSYFLQGKLDACLELLIRTGRLPEAAFLARTYLPSQVSRVVKLWRENLSKVNQKAAESLADPTEYENLFPGLKEAFVVEEWVKETRADLWPAKQYPLVTPNEERNVMEEAEGFQPTKMSAQQETDEKPASPTPVMASQTAHKEEKSLLELDVDLDNLELEDIDTTDINLDEDILDD